MLLNCSLVNRWPKRIGTTGFRFESRKVKNQTQNAFQHNFFVLSEEKKSDSRIRLSPEKSHLCRSLVEEIVALPFVDI